MKVLKVDKQKKQIQIELMNEELRVIVYALRKAHGHSKLQSRYQVLEIAIESQLEDAHILKPMPPALKIF